RRRGLVEPPAPADERAHLQRQIAGPLGNRVNRRKVHRQLGMDQLKDQLRGGQIPQPELTQALQTKPAPQGRPPAPEPTGLSASSRHDPRHAPAPPRYATPSAPVVPYWQAIFHARAEADTSRPPPPPTPRCERQQRNCHPPHGRSPPPRHGFRSLRREDDRAAAAPPPSPPARSPTTGWNPRCHSAKTRPSRPAVSRR